MHVRVFFSAPPLASVSGLDTGLSSRGTLVLQPLAHLPLGWGYCGSAHNGWRFHRRVQVAMARRSQAMPAALHPLWRFSLVFAPSGTNEVLDRRPAIWRICMHIARVGQAARPALAAIAPAGAPADTFIPGLLPSPHSASSTRAQLKCHRC